MLLLPTEEGGLTRRRSTLEGLCLRVPGNAFSRPETSTPGYGNTAVRLLPLSGICPGASFQPEKKGKYDLPVQNKIKP